MKRNEDKPHRCPNCHKIAERAWSAVTDNMGAGPRTVYACETCRVRWRVGMHVKRHNMAFEQHRVQWDNSSCKCCR